MGVQEGEIQAFSWHLLPFHIITSYLLHFLVYFRLLLLLLQFHRVSSSSQLIYTGYAAPSELQLLY